MTAAERTVLAFALGTLAYPAGLVIGRLLFRRGELLYPG